MLVAADANNMAVTQTMHAPLTDRLKVPMDWANPGFVGQVMPGVARIRMAARIRRLYTGPEPQETQHTLNSSDALLTPCLVDKSLRPDVDGMQAALARHSTRPEK